MHHPYIGITGPSKPEEVSAVLSHFPRQQKRKLMIGVVQTFKSLRGIAMKPKWAKQTPSLQTLPSLFLPDRYVVNLVHYSTEEGQEDSALEDLQKIHDLAGSHLHGFQLNLAWPSPKLISDYRAKANLPQRMVLQIGQQAMEAAGGTAKGIANMLQPYKNLIDDILIDPSGGMGKPFDTQWAREILTQIDHQGWSLGLGTAGGLAPDSLDLVKPLVAQFPSLNIDAQGRLRNADSELDMESVRTYLAKAVKLFDEH